MTSSMYDVVNYVLFTNPLSSSSINAAVAVLNGVTNSLGYQQPKIQSVMTIPALHVLASRCGPFVRIAALSGATAVILGAYGSHKSYPEESGQDLKRVFEVASRYHFIHTLAILGLPLCKKPYLALTFMTAGIFLFSGICYYSSFTGDKSFNKLTPIGGTCFIFGWLAMLL